MTQRSISRDTAKRACVAFAMASAAAFLLTADPAANSSLEASGHLRTLAATGQSQLTEIAWKPRFGRRGAKRPGLKPVMHTFYHWDDDIRTSEVSDREQLTEWAAAWFRAGWDVRVLTMKDVERHPDYAAYRTFLDGNPFGTHSSVSFWRWFAMGTVPEGGWMADYDTFPLNNFTDLALGRKLPSGGRLTTHAGRVPALVSGTQHEWNRMARFLVRQAQRKARENRNGVAPSEWSDLEALEDLHGRWQHGGEEKRFETTEWAVPASDFVAMGAFDEAKCAALRAAHRNAVHFSRREMEKAVKEGKLPKEAASEKRWAACEEWVGKWDRACNPKPAEEKATEAVA